MKHAINYSTCSRRYAIGCALDLSKVRGSNKNTTVTLAVSAATEAGTLAEALLTRAIHCLLFT